MPLATQQFRKTGRGEEVVQWTVADLPLLPPAVKYLLSRPPQRPVFREADAVELVIVNASRYHRPDVRRPDITSSHIVIAAQ